MAKDYFEKYFAPGYSDKLPSGCWPSIGADIGLTNDHTVIVVMDRTTNKQIFFWRFCPGDAKSWDKNYAALEWTWKYFQMPLKVDCTGFGSHIPGEMSKRGVPLEQWGGGVDKMKWNAENKPLILDNLSSLIGGHNINLFNLPIIRSELKQMQRIARESGGFRIASSKNGHDDIPIALGLACIGIRPLLLSNVTDDPTITTGEQSIWMTEEW